MATTVSPPSPLPKFENHAAQEYKFTTCYMCACRCGVRVTLENNKIRYIQGNPNHPVNRGVLCGKGNAAIMKQYSPAKLKHPMIRKPGSERGAGEFSPISWDGAIAMLAERLAKIRAKNPNELAFFTGRDQMQALTGLWATQFGTLNWAAHGGFCSVNMAAAGLMTTGFSFWEFGEPDWDNARLFVLWGVAEDHASNPIKIGLKKLKERGCKIIAVNPVRTGYQAIADEWVAITPGTDGLLALSIAYTLLSERRIDEEFLVRYTNMPHLVGDDGLFVRDNGEQDSGQDNEQDSGQPLVWCQNANAERPANQPQTAPALVGEYQLADGRAVKTAMKIALDTYLSDEYRPENAATICGVAAADIRRIAHEMADAAFNNPPVVETVWTDCHGNRHEGFIGRAVAMHAMRGISAHSNGFQSCRALHFLQALLGAIDAPGSHLAKPPYPKHPPAVPRPAKSSAVNKPLSAPPLGLPRTPDDLAVTKDGKPLRIDKAYSWDAPLSAHGMMHMVIANAANGDPYPIDTLLLFMANLAWNSSMNTNGTIECLKAKNEDGEYKIPFIVTVDAFHSEMVNYSDLVLADTTYLERYDTISLLDRPISEPHAVCDAIRQPVLEREYDTRPWQEVLVELATTLKFPAFTDSQGLAKYKDYRDFIINWEKTEGIGFLSGWRGEDGGETLRGKPNPEQWQRYIENECFFREELPAAMRYYRFANRDYLQYAYKNGWTESAEPILIELYSETLRRFQLAGEGQGECLPPTERQRFRLREYFRALPFYYPPLEQMRTDKNKYPFYAVTQRPMFMYHSWDSQNSWLRQIAAQNYIYINRRRATEMGIADGDWVWLTSHIGKIGAEARTMDGVSEDTVWTWNAIGKSAGAWGLEANANESVEGFIMNHLISEWLPKETGETTRVENSDPITGQAAWYDLRVAIHPMSAVESAKRLEQTAAMVAAAKNATPNETPLPLGTLGYATHKAVHLLRPLSDILTK